MSGTFTQRPSIWTDTWARTEAGVTQDTANEYGRISEITGDHDAAETLDERIGSAQSRSRSERQTERRLMLDIDVFAFWGEFVTEYTRGALSGN
jgi:hypothetical protein